MLTHEACTPAPTRAAPPEAVVSAGPTATEAGPAPPDKDDDQRLAACIGLQVKALRLRRELTVAEAARLVGLSPGMLSKIENGSASPSLATMHALSRAFNVPMTSLFERFEEKHDCCYTRRGSGLRIESRGSAVGHQYQLLGHGIGRDISVAPYLISMTDESEVFPVFQHEGVEFIHMLEGEVRYQHGNRQYHLRPGDSLFFEAHASHGPAELVKLPIRFLAIICQSGTPR